MTQEEIKQSVLQALTDVAPEADTATLRTDLSCATSSTSTRWTRSTS